jgi:hypothetical protein
MNPAVEQQKRRLPPGWVLILGLGLVVGALIMWALTPQEQGRPMVAAIRRIVRFRRQGDAALAERLSSVLDLPDGVAVTVERGVVFLTGTVASEEEIEELLGRVRDIPGVRSVAHDLTVRTDSTA